MPAYYVALKDIFHCFGGEPLVCVSRGEWVEQVSSCGPLGSSDADTCRSFGKIVEREFFLVTANTGSDHLAVSIYEFPGNALQHPDNLWIVHSIEGDLATLLKVHNGSGGEDFLPIPLSELSGVDVTEHQTVVLSRDESGWFDASQDTSRHAATKKNSRSV